MSILRRNPSQRRLLYIMSASEYAEVDGRGLAQLEQSNTLQVVSLLDLQTSAADELAAKLADNPAAVAGAILVQDPFRRDVYVDAAVAERSLATEKAQLLSRLAQYLGARSLHFEEFDQERQERQQEVGGDAAYSAIRGNTAVARDLQELREDLLRLSDDYAGSDPDIASARRFLDEHHLTDESDLVHLVESAAHSSNPLRSRTLLMSVNREVITSLDVLAELGSRVLPSKVSAKYTDAVKQRREIKATYKITF